MFLGVASCVSFATIKPMPPTLHVDALPAVITQSTSGTVPITGVLAAGSPTLVSHVTASDGATPIGSVDVTGDGAFSITWTFPVAEQNVTHVITVTCADALGRALPAQTMRTTISLLGPAIASFAVAPSQTADGALIVSWQPDADTDHVVIAPSGAASLTVTPSDVTLHQTSISGLTPGQTYAITFTATAKNGNTSVLTESAAPGLVFVKQSATREVTAPTGSLTHPFSTITAALGAIKNTAVMLTVHAMAGTYTRASGETFPIIVGALRGLEGERDASGAWLTHIAGSSAFDISSPSIIHLCPSVIALGDEAHLVAAATDHTVVHALDIDAIAADDSTCNALTLHSAVVSTLLDSDIAAIHTSEGQNGIYLGGSQFVHRPVVHHNDLEGLGGIGSSGVYVSGLSVPTVEHNVVVSGTSSLQYCYFYSQTVARDFSDASLVVHHRGNSGGLCQRGVELAADVAVEMSASDDGTRNTLDIGGPFALPISPTNSANGVIAIPVGTGEEGKLVMCGTTIHMHGSSEGIPDIPDQTCAANNCVLTAEIVRTASRFPLYLGDAPLSVIDNCHVDPNVQLIAESRIVGVDLAPSSGGGLVMLHTALVNHDRAIPTTDAGRSVGVWFRSNASVPWTITNSLIQGFSANLVVVGPAVAVTSTCVDPTPDARATGARQGTTALGIASPNGIADASAFTDASEPDKLAINFSLYAGSFIFATNAASPPCPAAP